MSLGTILSNCSSVLGRRVGAKNILIDSARQKRHRILQAPRRMPILLAFTLRDTISPNNHGWPPRCSWVGEANGQAGGEAPREVRSPLSSRREGDVAGSLSWIMSKLWLGSAVTLLCALAIVMVLPATRLMQQEKYAGSSSASTWARVDVPLTDLDAAVERFAGVLRFKTISSKTATNHVEHPEDFKALHKYLRKQWPLVFQKLQVNMVSMPRALCSIRNLHCRDKKVQCHRGMMTRATQSLPKFFLDLLR